MKRLYLSLLFVFALASGPGLSMRVNARQEIRIQPMQARPAARSPRPHDIVEELLQPHLKPVEASIREAPFNGPRPRFEGVIYDNTFIPSGGSLIYILDTNGIPIYDLLDDAGLYPGAASSKTPASMTSFTIALQNYSSPAAPQDVYGIVWFYDALDASGGSASVVSRTPLAGYAFSLAGANKIPAGTHAYTITLPTPLALTHDSSAPGAFPYGVRIRLASDSGFTTGSANVTPIFNGNGVTLGHSDDIFWDDVNQDGQFNADTEGFSFDGGPGTFSNLYFLVSGTAAAAPFPPAPPVLAGLPGSQTATMTWTPSAYATSYTLKRSATSGGPYSVIATLNGTTYADTGLTNGVTYYYVVDATNPYYGATPNSNEAAVTPTVPFIGNGGGLYGNYFPGGALDFSDENNAPFLFRVDPVINFNNGNPGVAYNPLPWPAGVPTSDFTAVWTGQVQAPFTGSYRFQTITDDGVRLSLDTGTGLQPLFDDQTSHGPLANTGAAVNLFAGQKYNIKMEYTQGIGPYTAQLLYSLNGTPFQIIPQSQLYAVFIQAPNTPTNLTATAGSGLITLNWNASVGAASYTVKRSATNGGPYTTIATNVLSTQYTDTNVVNGVTYYYVVCAVNNIGVSGISNQASATPSITAPARQVYTYHLNCFKVQNISVWANGPPPLNIDKFFGFNLPGSSYGIGDTNLNDCDWGLGLGASLQPTKVGFAVHTNITLGTVTISYPMTVTISVPVAGSVAAGQQFQVGSTVQLDCPALINVSGPVLDATLHALAQAGINVQGYLSGRWGVFQCHSVTYQPTLFNYSVNHDDTLFDLQALLGNQNCKSFSLFNGLLTGDVCFPDLNNVGGCVNDPNQPFLIRSSKQSKIFDINCDLTDVIADAFGLPSPNGSFSFGGNLIGASANWNLIDLIAGCNLYIKQDISLNATSVPITLSGAGSPVTFNAGQSVLMTMPQIGSSLTLSPKFTLNNDFRNQTSLVVEPNLSFNPLEVNASANAVGHSFSFHFKPLPTYTLSANLTIPLYDQTSHLAFPMCFGDPITLSPWRPFHRRIGGILPASLPHKSPFNFNPANIGEFLNGYATLQLALSESPDNPSLSPFLRLHGHTEILQGTLTDAQTMSVRLPNKYLLVADTMQIGLTDSAGAVTNTMDFTVANPVPEIVGFGSGPDAVNGPDNTTALFTLPATTNDDRYVYARVVNPALLFEEAAYLQQIAGDVFPGLDLDMLPVSATLLLDGQPLQTAYQNISADAGSALSATLVGRIPASLLEQAGTHTVQIANSAPGGGMSAPFVFTVVNPAPTLTAIGATTKLQPSSPATSLSLNGTGFTRDTAVTVNGVPHTTHYAAPTQIAVDLTDSDLAHAATFAFVAVNPAPGGGASNTLTYALANPVPTVAELGLLTVYAGSQDVHLAIRGDHFVPDSTARWNGMDRPTTYVSSGLLSVTLTGIDLGTVGGGQITVFNPAPGGGVSNPLPLTVSPGGAVFGAVALEGVSDLTTISAGAPLGKFHVEFRTPGTTHNVFTADVTLTPDGAGSPFGTFTLSDIPTGMYDVRIKGGKNLAVALPGVVVYGNTFLDDLTLPGGDATNDNTIDIADFGVLVNAYNGNVSLPGSGYDPAADFNYDGVNDIADFGILVNEYSASGAL